MAIAKELTKAILNEHQAHPQLTLIDYYKYFSQSAFGPGHIIKDIDSARAYLEKELEESTAFDPIEIQACDYFLPFYRVNLSLLKEEKLGIDEYFTAFIKSAHEIEPIKQMHFLARWENIVNAIKKLYIMNIEGDEQLPSFAQDLFFLQEMHQQGQYICHHSNQFKRAYNPHYRLIHRDFIPKALINDLAKIPHCRK